MQRFGHENSRARLFLQGVPHKAGRLIHSQGLMIIVYHLAFSAESVKKVNQITTRLGYDIIKKE
jgi:hypothetical protein